MFLLDTNVLSELRKIALRRADPTVSAWAESVSHDNFRISVVTIFELERGIIDLERKRPQDAEPLRIWFETVILKSYAAATLPVTIKVARRCTELRAAPQDTPDALIAATALVHGLTVVTRNTSDFTPMGVPVFNPWEAVAPSA